MSKVVYKGTITIVRTIEVLEDGHNWSDEITVEGLPAEELENLLECDLLDLNENLYDHIGTMDGPTETYLNLPAFTADRGGFTYDN